MERKKAMAGVGVKSSFRPQKREKMIQNACYGVEEKSYHKPKNAIYRVVQEVKIVKNTPFDKKTKV